MSENVQLSEIIRYAIETEQQSCDAYKKLYEQASDPKARDLYKQLIQQKLEWLQRKQEN